MQFSHWSDHLYHSLAGSLLTPLHIIYTSYPSLTDGGLFLNFAHLTQTVEDPEVEEASSQRKRKRSEGADQMESEGKKMAGTRKATG